MTDRKKAPEDVAPNEIQEALGGLEYPADKQTLVRHARDRGAREDVVRMIQALPEKQYGGPTDVSHEYGKLE